MKRKISIAILLAAVFILALNCLSGCGTGGSEEKTEDSAVDSQAVTIVTSFYPMYVLTLNITEGIDGVEVVNMAQPQTGCLHDYQLSTADMKILDSADVLVVNGAGMESFLDKVTEQLPEMQVITASEGMDLLEHEHEVHGGDAHVHSNPHVWVSPMGAAQEVKTIAAGLAGVDPVHAEQYQANADAFVKELEILKADMQEKLDTLPNRKLVTFHEAFPYFAQEFNFEIAAVIENEPGQEPVASEIDKIISTIRENNIPAIFVEAQYADQTARIIASEAGVDVYELDLVTTGSMEQSPEEIRDSYVKAMQKNLDVFMEALQ